MANQLRISVIKSLLRDGRTWTARALSERTETSIRNIQRDIEHLRTNEKWPIDSGKSGYFLRERSIAETKVTQPEELTALALAYETLKKVQASSLAENLREEILKICRHHEGLGIVDQTKLTQVIDDRQPSPTLKFNAAIHGKLLSAILQQQLVDIRYRNLEEDSSYERTIYPFRLLCRDSCWYLSAWDLKSGSQKTYALPRISAALVRLPPDDFVLPEFVNHHEHAFGIWTPYVPNGDIHEVCVELHGYWARIAKERNWHPNQRVEELSADCVRVHFCLNELVEVKSWVLKFGGAAKVISPPSLIELVQEELTLMNEHYAL
ncbi:MAG: WYL domain-containing protein [Luteolibacter sp.]